MSLINDALKRASQSAKNRPEQAGAASPMQPVAHARRSNGPLLIGIVAAVSLAGAGVFFWQAFSTRSKPAPAPAAATAPKPTPPLAVAKVEPVPPPAPVTSPAPVSAPVAAPVAVVPPAVVETSAPAPKPFPNLKLQGIFFSSNNPKVIINGQTIGVGDLVEGVRVTKIRADKVVLEYNGETRELLWGQ